MCIIHNTMRAAHMTMAKETTAEQKANAKNWAAIKNFFKDMFDNYYTSLRRIYPTPGYFA